MSKSTVYLPRVCVRCGSPFAIPEWVLKHGPNRGLYCSKSCPRPLVPHPTDPTAILVPLTQDKVAMVSPQDAERVGRHNWSASCLVRNGHEYWHASTAIEVDGASTTIGLHRFVMDDPDGVEIDHRDGNTFDCRRGNLREATQGQNQQNRPKRAGVPYRGINFHWRRWRAEIEADGNRHYLGSFDTPEEAAQAYDDAARRFHGEFACVNFPRDGERGA